MLEWQYKSARQQTSTEKCEGEDAQRAVGRSRKCVVKMQTYTDEN